MNSKLNPHLFSWRWSNNSLDRNSLYRNTVQSFYCWGFRCPVYIYYIYKCQVRATSLVAHLRLFNQTNSMDRSHIANLTLVQGRHVTKSRGISVITGLMGLNIYPYVSQSFDNSDGVCPTHPIFKTM